MECSTDIIISHRDTKMPANTRINTGKTIDSAAIGTIYFNTYGLSFFESDLGRKNTKCPYL